MGRESGRARSALSTALRFTFFGTDFNLLPLLMGATSILSTMAAANVSATEKKSLFLMSACFSVLFYHFAAGLVLYWTLSIILQAVQSKLLQGDVILKLAIPTP